MPRTGNGQVPKAPIRNDDTGVRFVSKPAYSQGASDA